MSNPAPKAPQRTYWMMSSMIQEPIEQYLYDLLPPRDEVLAEMEAEAERRKIPIVGPAVGRLFQLLARISGAVFLGQLAQDRGQLFGWSDAADAVGCASCRLDKCAGGMVCRVERAEPGDGDRAGHLPQFDYAVEQYQPRRRMGIECASVRADPD